MPIHGFFCELSRQRRQVTIDMMNLCHQLSTTMSSRFLKTFETVGDNLFIA